LIRRLPKLKFADAVSFLNSVRAVKTPAEVDVLTRVNRLTADCIERAFRSARPGETERTIAARMQYEFLKGGGEQITAPLLSAGTRSGLWHAMPNEQKLENGMVLTTDFGGLLEGYYSDIARTAVMGKASPRQRDMHAKLTEIKHRIVAAIRPGVIAGEVAQLGRKAYDDLDLEFKWGVLGHGIGLGLNETPHLFPWATEPILTGMTMMIETAYKDYPNESFHVEDLIHIKENGAEYLTDASRHEKIWELGVD
jgi:Xaa-Pro aminopeptidase